MQRMTASTALQQGEFDPGTRAVQSPKLVSVADAVGAPPTHRTDTIVSRSALATDVRDAVDPSLVASLRRSSRIVPTTVAAPPPREIFVVLQEWEGVVDEVASEVFYATLRDRTRNAPDPTERVELPIDDVSDDD